MAPGVTYLEFDTTCMPYFECEDCGQMANMTVMDASTLRQQCPVCEEQTTWTLAFESDEGVTF